MAQSDWTAYTAATNGALDGGDISKGVTNAFTPPDGGASFVHGFNSLTAVTGFAGRYYNPAAFNPISSSKGGQIRGAMRRYSTGIGYAPMMGFLSGTNVISNTGYVLGLSNTDPFQIVLAKIIPGTGLPATGSGILRVSDEFFNTTTEWFHLRLDVIVNPHGDVRLAVFRNDLDDVSLDVATQDWVAISGMDPYTDDALSVLTGTAPLTSGFRGFFGHYNDGLAGKVSLFDHIQISRQTAP